MFIALTWTWSSGCCGAVGYWRTSLISQQLRLRLQRLWRLLWTPPPSASSLGGTPRPLPPPTGPAPLPRTVLVPEPPWNLSSPSGECWWSRWSRWANWNTVWTAAASVGGGRHECLRVRNNTGELIFSLINILQDSPFYNTVNTRAWKEQRRG